MSGSLISGSLTPYTGTVPVDIDQLFSLILDPAAYGAAGSTITGTGTINLGGTTLAMDHIHDFVIGQSIFIYETTTPSTAVSTFMATISTINHSGTTTSFIINPASTVAFSAATVYHDDASAINAAISAGNSTLISTGLAANFQVNGGGRTYYVSGPITQQSGLLLENFGLIPLPSAEWFAGTLSTTTNNGVIYNPPAMAGTTSLRSASDVICRGISIDLNRVPNVNGIVNYGAAGVYYQNCKVIHWKNNGTPYGGMGLYNAGKCKASNCDFAQWEANDREAEDAPSYNSGFALCCDNVSLVAGGDSSFESCNFTCGLPPVYVSELVNNVRFSLCHTWPAWSNNTSIVSNPVNMDIHGTAITIDGHYLDNGYINIDINPAIPSPNINIGIGQCVYDSNGLTSYTSHIVASSTLGAGTLGNLFIAPDNLFGGGPQQFSLNGSFGVLSTTIQSAVLAAQTHNLMTVKGGLLIADLGTSSVVNTLMGSNGSFCLQGFVDSKTTTIATPQIRSNGDDIILMFNGEIAFRGSKKSDAAIIGPSPAGQTFFTHTVYSAKTAKPALQVMNTDTIDPQGLIVNFPNSTIANKTDPAFGFSNQISSPGTTVSGFQTAIWSDGSVAHPFFGFNISEFGSLPVAGSTVSSSFQIATGQPATENIAASILAGTYEIYWISNGFREHHMIIAVGCASNDTTPVITVLHNYWRGNQQIITNPVLYKDSANNTYFAVTVTPTMYGGILNAQARGYATGIGVQTLASGLTLLSPTVAILNQTGGGTILNALVESGSTINSVTNKIKIEIGGTTYYLLASTSGV